MNMKNDILYPYIQPIWCFSYIFEIVPKFYTKDVERIIFKKFKTEIILSRNNKIILLKFFCSVQSLSHVLHF